MKILVSYYSFNVILFYLIYTVIKMLVSKDKKIIINQFIKAIIVVPILVHLLFA